jgi:hypothetical protein
VLDGVEVREHALNLMAISTRDQRFIEARRERRRIGLFFFPIFLTCLVAVWASFFLVLPMSVNPWVVIGRIERQQLEPGALTMYAITATVLMNVVFLDERRVRAARRLLGREHRLGSLRTALLEDVGPAGRACG